MTAAKLDPALCRKLAAESTEDDRRMTPAPWAKFGPWPSVTIYRDQGDDDSTEPDHVCDVYTSSDRMAPPPERWLAEADSIARSRNNLPAIAAQLTAAAELAERPMLTTADDVRAVVRGVLGVAIGDSIATGYRLDIEHVADRIMVRLAGRVLATAFDRAAVAITGQPAAELNEQFDAKLGQTPEQQIVRVAPSDTAIIDRALGFWSSDDNDAPHDDIARIRAALTGTVLS